MPQYHEGKLVSLTASQTMTNTVAVTTNFYFPWLEGAPYQLFSMLQGKKWRIKQIVLYGTPLAAPIKIWPIVHVGQSVATEVFPAVTLVDGDMVALETNDCIRSYGSVTPIYFIAFLTDTSAIGVGDVIETFVSIEVVD